MSSIPKIFQADLEKLNTYLDGALSPKEKAEFELKLSKSLPLQSTLREYTILRNALRSLPPKKAPHHFTLTTAEAQQTKRPLFLAPFFSFASLVTVMLLAIVFASDWIFTNMSAPAAPAASLAVEAPMVARKSEPTDQTIEQPNAIQARTDAPLIFNWSSGQVGGFGMGGGSEMAMGKSADSGSVYMGDSRVINPGVVTESVPSDMLGGEIMSTEPLEPPSPTPMTTFMVPVDYAGAVIWGLLPEYEGEVIAVYPMLTDETQPEADPMQDDAEIQSQEAAQPARKVFQTAPWIKYSLAGLTLLFGLLAFFFARRVN
jgi:hypothetical protein